ncbi:MAG TPA: AraC family transcriptional regulator [Puia sp.]|jgi:AraC-like DNA-binding protein|nr:AraC family transcriptional regulator [Puia sp.]
MIISHKKFDLWGKTLIETIIIKPPYRLSVDFPQQACFIYYKKGKTQINSPAEQVLVGSDESVILNCGTYFANLLEYSDGDFYEILVFHLHADTLKKLYRQEFPAFLKKGNEQPYIQKIASKDIIRKFIENLDFYFENPTFVNDDILELKVKELILILLQSKNSTSIKDLLRDLFTPRELNIRDIVQRHLYSNITVKDLAELANMTLATFNRKFTEVFQDTPANYIKTKRLERARDLLQVSTLTISEIAFQTCFNDVSHFSRSFKQQFKVTPASCRERESKHSSR